MASEYANRMYILGAVLAVAAALEFASWLVSRQLLSVLGAAALAVAAGVTVGYGSGLIPRSAPPGTDPRAP
jgi:hypothetical protein